MKIFQSIISQTLAAVKPAIADKTGYTAKQCVLVEDDRVIAYDNETGITAKLPEPVNEPFVLTPNALAMINSLPGRELDITPAGSEIIISADGLESRFATVPAEEFTKPPVMHDAGGPVTIDGAVLSTLVPPVLYACSTDPTRPVCKGVLFEACGGMINTVAVDGYRAAWNTAEAAGEFKFIVPQVSLNSVLKLKPAGVVRIYHNDKSAVFETEDRMVHTRLISGEFLNYRSVFPARDNQFTVSRHELTAAMGRVMICYDKNAPVVVTLDGSDMTLSIKTPLGNHTETITVDGDTGAGLRIGLNPKYLQDAVKSYGTGEISLSFGSALEPLVISAGSLRSLLLPVRLDNHG